MSEDESSGQGLQPRLLSLDALRGLAVVLMVQQHLGLWLLDFRHVPRTVGGLFAGINSLGGEAAPLFIVLAGVGATLASARQKSWGRSFRLSFRGLLLYACGTLLNVLTPSWFSVSSFYVLHLIGALLILGPLLVRAPGALLLALAALLLVGAPVLQANLGTPGHLSSPFMNDAGKAGGALRLIVAEGHFPIFPWLSLGVLGVWLGRCLKQENEGLLLGVGGGLLGAGLGLILAAPVLGSMARRLPWRGVFRVSFYPPSVAFVLLVAGITVLLLVAAGRAEAKNRFSEDSLWVHLGRTSLTLFVLHVVVFRELTDRLGMNGDLPAFAVVGIIVGVLVLFALVARRWSRVNYVGGLEWWLRRVG